MIAETLSISGPDGQTQEIVKKGAQAPAVARAVFATQRAGERGLSFKLFEGEGAARLIGTFQAELPPGLPGNTWLAVFVTVGDDHVISVEVKENLRRIRVDPECDLAGATAKTFTVRG
jgi:hypothetical protein